MSGRKKNGPPSNGGSVPPRAPPEPASSGTDAPTTGRATGLPDLLTVAEVAIWLHTTPKGIYGRVDRGVLPGITRLGGRVFFLRSEMLRWVSQGRVPSPGGSS